MAAHLDERDPAIANFFPRVIAIVQGVLETVMNTLGTRRASERGVEEYMRRLGETVEMVDRKARAVGVRK